MCSTGLKLLSSASLLALAACDTVQLTYKDTSSDPTQVLADAQDGYHYFELPRSYIVFTKASKDGSTSPATKSNSNSTKDDPPGETKVAGTLKGLPVNHGHGHGSVNQGDQHKPQAPANGGGGQGSGASPAPQLPSWPGQTIGPDTWAVSVIPVASGNGVMVKGRVNFWQSTTLGVARYENSDMPSTISSKAENLVAKRIGQGFSLLSDIVGVAAPLGVKGGSPPAASNSGLQPFSVKVTGSADEGSVNDDWDWKLTYDSGPAVVDALPLKTFRSSVGSEAVGYWPVPACRAATLTLTDKNHKTAQNSYAFHVVVGTPEWVRPEPLPVDGSLTLGSACSGSTKGTTAADPGTDAFNIADGFAKGVESLSKKSGSGAAATASGN